MENENFDGQIFLSENELTLARIQNQNFNGDLWEAEESHPIKIDFLADRVLTDVFSRLLAKWIDPLTPPKIRNKCVKYCSSGPIRFCCGWKLEKRWYYREATLIVSLKNPKDIRKDVEDCLKTAAIAAAIAAVVSGGSAAIATAEKILFGCLSSKIGSELVSVRISIDGYWGNWE